MISLMFAAALAQASGAPDPCYAGPPQAARAGCPRWQLVSRDERGARYYDPASGRVSNNMVEVLTRTDAAAMVEGVAVVVARMRLDCAARTFTILHISGYNRDGIRVSDGDPPARPQPVRPGLDAGRLLADFCPH